MSDNTDLHFVNLILSYQMAGMGHLGKVANPVTGEVEKNLEAAKFTIDLLESLERKTEGNRSDEEDKLLRETLTNLRLNFVDESAGEESGEQPADTPAEEKTADETGEAAAAGDGAGETD